MKRRKRHEIGVYHLEKILDDPRYYGFGYRHFPEQIPRDRTTRKWEVIRLAPRWKRIQVQGRVRPFNDAPGVSGVPAFSLRAVEALKDLLEPNGELLPLKTRCGSFFAFNTTTVADVLDFRKSKIYWLEKPITALNIERYHFFSRRLQRLSIFRIPEDPAQIFVTDRFVERVKQHNLRGFDFIKVWPLPRGANWGYLAHVHREERSGEGLPLGQTICGQSVFIILSLKTPQSEPTDELVETLKPWLRTLKWPYSITVVKRYGPYFEPKVPEKRIKL